MQNHFQVIRKKFSIGRIKLSLDLSLNPKIIKRNDTMCLFLGVRCWKNGSEEHNAPVTRPRNRNKSRESSCYTDALWSQWCKLVGGEGEGGIYVAISMGDGDLNVYKALLWFTKLRSANGKILNILQLSTWGKDPFWQFCHTSWWEVEHSERNSFWK